MKMNKKIIVSIVFSFIFILIFLGIFTKEVYADENKFCYLSDIPYVANKSSVAWKQITADKTPDNTPLSIKIENAAYTFEKGIFAHANSTVVYDLTNYSEYAYFTSYLGLNTTSTRGDGVKFDIFTSVDGTTWESKMENGPLDKLPGQNATFVKIDIRGAKYLKLVANDKGSNASDHSVYVDAKLIKEDYNENENIGIKTVEEYNDILKKYDGQDIKKNEEYEFILLQRELVSRAGEYALKRFVTENESNKATIEWLFSDIENIRYYILGGTPTGGYYNSLKQLSRLLQAYKSDFDITETSERGTVKGKLYKRMAIAISLTHSSRVGLWMQSNKYNDSDAVVRYKLYKDLYDQGKFKKTDSVDITPWFEDYKIEELRWVVGTLIDDESIIWLNEYVQSKIDAAPNRAGALLTPHSYIAYVWPNYSNNVYYAAENKDYFNELFSVNGKGLFEYIPYRDTSEGKIYKLWMNFRNKFGTGCVCGGISKSGHCIRGVNGIASAVIGQPGHAALLYYSRNSNGQGYWGIDNDVSGWNYSEKGERMFLGWGNDRTYVKGYNVPYIVLAQEALNDYDNLEKAEEILFTASIYKDDKAKQEQIYRDALSVQSINLDAWAELAKLYMSDETKTEEDYYQLEVEMMEALKCFPFPMYNLSNYISTKFTSPEYKFKFALLQEKVLTEAKNYPNEGSKVLQPSLTRGFAAHLLGQVDTTLATFSFDGDDAGKIVLSQRFNGNGLRWDYSLDGKNTWNEVSFTAEEEHKLQLTDEQISTITSENDIYVHIVGANYSDENVFKIDIQESQGLPTILYANDLENKLIASIPTMKWQLKGENEWKFFRDEEPDLSGNKTIIVKAGARGVYLESNETREFTFTEDVVSEERKYISISHLSIHNFSTEAAAQGRHATNAIDGNIYTNWHSAWNGSDREKYIVIKLDEVKNLTALEYLPVAGGNGKIESAQIFTSLDGENWTEVVSGTDWTYRNTNDVSMKNVEFDPVKAQYIKIVGKKTQAASASNSFMVSAMFNLYENTTAKIAGTFSFDGVNGKQIILDNEFENKKWEYSLDGGTTWKSVEENSHELNAEELEQVNDNDKIKLRFEGSSREYSINIKKAELPKISAYINDWENRLIGITNTDNLEWKIKSLEKNTVGWTAYSEEEPIVEGNNTLLVRTKASGITSASDPVEFNFTAGTDTDKQKYVPIKHLSIHEYSTQSVDSNRPFYAPNAIDGNINTRWHTDFRVSVLDNGGKAFLTIKLDEPKYISALEFIQTKYRDNDPDSIKNAVIYVSMDGENWTEAGRKEECEQNEELKRIVFEESINAQYVKFEAEPYGIFASASMINLYEDTTKIEKPIVPTAEIEYSTTELTNKDVTATLVNESTDITVTNNNGSKTYTFTENGKFIFEFVDSKGTKGTAEAEVSCIDKVAPTATINYDVSELTDGNVVATLSEPSEEITITNNNGNETYVFTSNGEFTFEFVDKAGNKGTAKAKVDWIMTEGQKYEELKEQIIKIIEDYKTKVTDEELNNKKINQEEKKKVIEAYSRLKNEDKTEYTSFIDRINTGGKPVITLAQKVYSVKFGTEMNLYDFITIKDNEDGDIESNTDNVKITTNLDVNTPGIYDVEYEVKDSDNNVTRETIQVIVQDDDTPTAEIKYSTTESTTENVIATLVNESTDITVINNNGSKSYTFTSNGEFTFKFIDSKGNQGTATAKVTWIQDKDITTPSFDLSIETLKAILNPGDELEVNVKVSNLKNFQKGLIVLTGKFEYDKEKLEIIKISGENNWNLDENSFNDNNFKFITESDSYIVKEEIIFKVTLKIKEKVETPSEIIFKLVDIVGSNGEKDIFTNDSQLVVNVEEEKELIIGDINGDGKVTVTDIAKIKLHFIEKEFLTGKELMAADINKDGRITITDVALLKLIFLGLPIK